MLFKCIEALELHFVETNLRNLKGGGSMFSGLIRVWLLLVCNL